MSVFHENMLIGASGQGAAGPTAGRSVRFNSADSAYLSRGFSSGDQKKWTWSCWCKPCALSGDQGLFGVTGAVVTFVRFKAAQLDFVVGGATHRRTTAVFRDPSAWYHFVWAVDTSQSTASNRSRFYVNGVEVTAWSIDSALTQNSDTGISSNATHLIGSTDTVPNDVLNAYLALIHFVGGQQLTPSSFGETSATTGQWIAKDYSGSYGTNGFFLDFLDNSTAAALGYDAAGSNDWTVNNLAVWNGGSAMYSIGSFSNSLGYGFTTPGYLPAQSFDGSLTSFAGNNNGGGTNTWTAPAGITVTSTLRVYVATGAFPAGTTWAVNGTSQGSTSNGWLTASISTPYTLTSISNTLGSSATGAFFAAIEVNGTILVDKTNPGNDSLRDHPTSAGTSTGLGGEVSGNYATWNPLNTATYTFSNGNLEATGYAGNSQMVSTIGVSSGKWYCEISLSGSGGTSNAGIGISKGEQGTYPGELSTSYGYFGSGLKINAGSATSYGATYTYSDIIGIALDMDAGTCTMYKNGSSQGQLASGLSGTYFIAVRNSSNAGDKTIANFGARAFAYTAPSGFSPLVDTLLPTPTIAKPNTVMDVVLYTGNGSSSRAITGLNFSPDFVWDKSRNQAYSHYLFDIVRGANKALFSDTTDNEQTYTSYLLSFDSAGFTVGNGSQINANGDTYVAWTWDAGSSNATNTSGTITSTVRANISAGFSVVTYTGTGSNATVGHGLGVAPSMVIVKNRDAAQDWYVQHSSLGATKTLYLNTTSAQATLTSTWNNTNPTSTVFSVGGNTGTNGSSNGMVAYCWTPVAGLSSFGSYTGTGDTNGPFVYTGFRVRWLMVKITNAAGYNWVVMDAQRSTYNAASHVLSPNVSNAEYTDAAFDFLSNGFKPVKSSAETNLNGGTFVWAAFAEAPFPYARAR